MSLAADVFSRAAPGDTLPVIETAPLRRIQMAYMSVANNDPAEIHVDELFARKAGFPTVVAQGSFVLGHLGRVVSEWAGLRSVRSLHVQFRGAVFADDVLVVSGTVRGVTGDGDDRSVTLDLEVTKGDGSLVAKATATIGRKP